MAMANRASTEEDRQARRDWIESRKAAAEQLVRETIAGFSKDPAAIAEYLAFAATFRQYSLRNQLLILAQNPGARLCLPFTAWRERGYSVRKGEHGLQILARAPWKGIVVDGTLIPMSEATPEQKALAKSGELEVREGANWKLVTTFDVSQTNFPTDELPEILQMGIPSERHSALYDALKDHCESEMSCPVADAESTIRSVALKGFYVPSEHRIEVNPLLDDTAKVSTLTHEMGHALLHGKGSDPDITVAQCEFEADAVGIMLTASLGLPIEQSRAAHISKQYDLLEAAHSDLAEGDPTAKPWDREIMPAFQRAYEAFEGLSAKLAPTLERHGLAIPTGPLTALDSRLKALDHSRQLRSEAPKSGEEASRARTVADAAKQARARAEAARRSHTPPKPRRQGPAR